MKCLVFGADLEDDGASLGPRTIARVEQGIAQVEDDPDIELVFAAPFEGTRRFPRMRKPLGEMMFEYALKQKKGFKLIYINGAPTFNTEGEIKAFFKHGFGQEPFMVVSAGFHLPRIRLLIAQQSGFRFAICSVRYVSADSEERAGLRVLFLESCKWILLLLPRSFRPAAERSYEAVFGKRKI